MGERDAFSSHRVAPSQPVILLGIDKRAIEIPEDGFSHAGDIPVGQRGWSIQVQNIAKETGQRSAENKTVLDSVIIGSYVYFRRMDQSKTLAELSDASGIPARTIRFYIARGLLDGPVKAGRGAVYTSDHLARLEKIKGLQGEGRMLAEIAHDLARDRNDGPAAQEAAQRAVPPAAWWQHMIADDVMVWVRGDVSPWRMKQIRSAVDELASRLREPQDGNTRRNRK
jgi:DNA-binding transcriptional MerR regulator